MVNTGSTLTYEYSIADHQGNTRVVFTSATPAADAPATNFQDNGSGFDHFPGGGTLNTLEVFDHDANPATSNSTILNGGYNSQVGVTKSFKVYPGDKLKAEVYAKYRNASSGTGNLSGFALMLTNAFGVSSSSTGELLKAYNTLNDYGGAAALGTAHSSVPGAPKAFVTILLFDKNYNFLDAAWDQLDAAYEQTSVLTVKDPFDLLTKEVTVKEEGFAYVFISNESPTFVDVYFDDVKFTHTKTNVIQYNEYYPFGLQTSTSWTRDNTKDNNYLYNAANELNKTSGWYEMFYRGYDPAIGRMLQVDPYAPMYASTTTYNYAMNNPVMMNDPSGGQASAENHNYGISAIGQYRMDAIARMSESGNYFYDWDKSYFERTGGGDGTPFFSFWNNLKRAINRSIKFESSFSLKFAADGIWILKGEELVGKYVKTTKADRALAPGMSDRAWQMTLVKHRERAPSYFQGVKIVNSNFGDLGEGAGVTVPPNIFISEDYWKSAWGDAARRRSDLIRHEYGHILQHRRFGDIYYAHMAARSLASAMFSPENHETSMTEVEANTMSYFELGFPVDWNKDAYPINETYLLNLFKADSLGPK